MAGRSLLVLAAFLVLVTSSRSALAQSRERVPLLALRSEAAFFGTDAPDVVVYSDSTVLYATGGGFNRRPTFVITRLAPDRFRALIDSMNLSAFMAVDSPYDLCPGTTDVTYYYLHSWMPGASRTVVVRGYPLGESFCHAAQPAIQVAFRALTSLCKLSGSPWLPDSIEVALLEDTNSAWTTNERHPIRWPSAWPQGTDTPAHGWFTSTLRLIRMPVAVLPQVTDLQRRHGNYGGTPILLDHRYWFMTSRLLFPGEAAWRDNAPN